MDIRLKTLPFDFDGKHFELVCNMNVLCDVQEAYHGDLMQALRSASLRACTTFLSAMLNDYADSQGWEIRYTPRQVGRLLAADADTVTMLAKDVMSFVRQSLTTQDPEPGEAQGDSEKN